MTSTSSTDTSSTDKTSPDLPPGTKSEGASDLRDQIAALIALTVSERTGSGRKDKWSGSIGWIAAVTALLAAIGSSIGASQSLYTSTQASDTQRQINARQDIIDFASHQTSENARIGNLFTFYGDACGQIPTDDTAMWNDYSRCVFQTPVGQKPEGDFLQIPDDKRRECLKKYKMCGRRE